MVQAEAPFTPPAHPLRLNDKLADFTLTDVVRHRPYRLHEHLKDVLVVDFWSAECPISKQYDPYFNGFTESYGPKGVTFLAIDSNVYADEAQITRAVEERDITFPILRDPGNQIADYFDALTTPHLYVFDRLGHLRYRGAVDDRNFENETVTVNYLEEAVDALLLGRDIPVAETDPWGCTIVRVWKG